MVAAKLLVSRLIEPRGTYCKIHLVEFGGKNCSIDQWMVFAGNVLCGLIHCPWWIFSRHNITEIAGVYKRTSVFYELMSM